MGSSSTAVFRKQWTCPSAEALLLHGLGARAAGRGESLASHLSACEFCGAEMQLLSRFPPPPTNALPFVAYPLPASLRRLAEQVMAEPSLNRARYVESIQEVERLTLTDA